MPPVHPGAALFPLLPEPELQAMADDIKKSGQQFPCVIWHGQLLDGRNRWLACGRAGVEPKKITRDDIKDPFAFIVSVNLRHRHLTPSQAAMLGGALSELFEEEARGRMALGGRAAGGDAQALANLQSAPSARTNERAAAMVASSPRSVGSARLVLKSGVPALAAAVSSGAVAVSVAADVAALPKPELEELVAKGEAEILAKAKEIRQAKKAVRKPKDAYMSAGGFMRPLLPLLGPGCKIVECCAGDGDLVGPLRAAGHDVFTVDIDPTRKPDRVADMTKAEAWRELPGFDWVVSNLPFNEAINILPHAVERAAVGVAVILRLTFLEPTTEGPKARAKWLAEHPLTKQIVLPRYSFTGDGSTDSVTCAIMVWERGAEPAIFIPFPDENGMPGDCFPVATAAASAARIVVDVDGARAEHAANGGETILSFFQHTRKEQATEAVGPTPRQEAEAIEALRAIDAAREPDEHLGDEPAPGAQPSDELVERVSRLWIAEMAPEETIEEARRTVRVTLAGDDGEAACWEGGAEFIRDTAVTEQAAIDERDGACFECHAKPGEVHGGCADQGIPVKAAEGEPTGPITCRVPTAAEQADFLEQHPEHATRGPAAAADWMAHAYGKKSTVPLHSIVDTFEVMARTMVAEWKKEVGCFRVQLTAPDGITDCWKRIGKGDRWVMNRLAGASDEHVTEEIGAPPDARRCTSVCIKGAWIGTRCFGRLAHRERQIHMGGGGAWTDEDGRRPVIATGPTTFDGACNECGQHVGDDHAEWCDGTKGAWLVSRKGELRPDGTTIAPPTPPAAPPAKPKRARRSAKAPAIRLTDPQFIAAIEAAYSADTIAAKGIVRTPFALAGRLWISLGGESIGNGKNKSERVEAWRLTPIAHWTGPSFTVAELHDSWDSDEKKRGDSTGLRVLLKVKGKSATTPYVLDGERRSYAWGPEEL